MALQSSGQISLNDMHLELGASSGTEVSMNDSDIRGLIDKSSGAQMSFSEWYGASDVSAPVWNSSTYTFDLGTPDTIETKTADFNLSASGAVAIIAIGGGGGGAGIMDYNYSGNNASTGGSASGGDANYVGGSGINITTGYGNNGGNGYGGGGGAGGGNGGQAHPQSGAAARGTSPLDTGWLATYIGNGGRGGVGSWPYYQGETGQSYGGGGGAGGTPADSPSNAGRGGDGANGIVLVCYWN